MRMIFGKTYYTPEQGDQSPRSWVRDLKANQIEAAVVVDRMTIAGAPVFFREARQNAIRPILGCEVCVACERVASDRPNCLILICKSSEGYQNLCRLVSIGFGKAVRFEPIPLERLERHRMGLYALYRFSADEKRQLSQSSEDATRLKNTLSILQEVFGDAFMLELVRVSQEYDVAWQQPVIEIAHELKIPLVASYPMDVMAGEVPVASRKMVVNGFRDQPAEILLPEWLCRVLQTRQIASLFADVPEALDNQSRIIESFQFDLETYLQMASRSVGFCGSQCAVTLRQLAGEGLSRILQKMADGSLLAAGSLVDYQNRLEVELQLIEKQGLSEWFLFLRQMMVEAAEQRGLPCLVGGGLITASLVAWALGLSVTDPILIGCDFDVAWSSGVHHPRVIRWYCAPGARAWLVNFLKERFGTDKVAHLTFVKPLSAEDLKIWVQEDISRKLEQLEIKLDRIGWMLKPDQQHPAVKDEPMESNPLPQLTRLQIENYLQGDGEIITGPFINQDSFVVHPQGLRDYFPLLKINGSELEYAIPFDVKDLDRIGWPVLQIEEMQCLEGVFQQGCMQSHGVYGDGHAGGEGPATSSCGDRVFTRLQESLSYDHTHLFAKAKPIFQLPGIRQLMDKAGPKTVEDLLHVLALFRPEPLGQGMGSDFYALRTPKESSRRWENLPVVADITRSTRGVLLYSEQIVAVAEQYAGLARKQALEFMTAMQGGDPVLKSRQGEVFIAAARKNGYEESEIRGLLEEINRAAPAGIARAELLMKALISHWVAG